MLCDMLCRVGDCLLLQLGTLVVYLQLGLVHLQSDQLTVSQSSVAINDSIPHSLLLVRSHSFLVLLLDGEQIATYTGS